MFGVDDAVGVVGAGLAGAEQQPVLGQRGVVAAAHYDSSHNYVLQVFGRKTWALWPPDAAGAPPGDTRRAARRGCSSSEAATRATRRRCRPPSA